MNFLLLQFNSMQLIIILILLIFQDFLISINFNNIISINLYLIITKSEYFQFFQIGKIFYRCYFIMTNVQSF